LVNNQNGKNENEPDIEYAEKILTTIDLGEDGKIEFSEFAPGEILISALVRNTVELPKKKLNSVEYYEFIKKENAPQVLVAANIRAEKYIDVTGPEAPEADEIMEPLSKAERMSAQEFSDTYCPTAPWDYGYCWLNRTGTSYVKKWCFSMDAYASPYRGTIRHRLKKGSTVVRDHTVLENWVSHISSTSPWRTRESKVFEADGDGYHHTIYGLN
jgi:hypothetical protein